MEAFLRDPAQDEAEETEALLDSDRGPHAFFRRLGPRMQERFVALVEPTDIPVVLVHGNPHLDNYVKTARGAAMVDFDRSRYGPYSYDLARFVISLSLRGPWEGEGFYNRALEAVFEGYARGVLVPWDEAPEPGFLREVRPAPWEKSTRRYLKAGKRWARRLKKHAVSPEHPLLVELCRQYLAFRSEVQPEERKTIKGLKIVKAAMVPGSLGKLHHVVLLDGPGADDPWLVDIKETYDEGSGAHFFNPFDHNGKRMLAAGEVYAPGWELRPGHAHVEGSDYWCRQIPTHAVKLKQRLSFEQQEEVGYCVGMQLGQGHRRSMLEPDTRELLSHFCEHWAEIVEVAAVMRDELHAAWAEYRQAAD